MNRNYACVCVPLAQMQTRKISLHETDAKRAINSNLYKHAFCALGAHEANLGKYRKLSYCKFWYHVNKRDS